MNACQWLTTNLLPLAAWVLASALVGGLASRSLVKTIDDGGLNAYDSSVLFACLLGAVAGLLWISTDTQGECDALWAPWLFVSAPAGALTVIGVLVCRPRALLRSLDRRGREE